MTTPQPVHAAGVLLFRESPARQFLLMKHPARWDLPKGLQEPDETPLECALREMGEETGLTADHVRIVPDFRFETAYTFAYPDSPTVYHKTLVVFLGWLEADAPLTLTEHEGYQWFAWNPPHRFDNATIDPLLAAAEAYFRGG